MNVLLIEDETRVADFLRRGLAAEGWSVEYAKDGETGLELAGAHPFDIILLDLMLPGISGQDVCRKLRARRVKTPILMLSALEATEERIVGLRIGADDYLPKPFDFDELIARIEALHRRATDYVAVLEDTVMRSGRLAFDKTSFVTTLDGEEIDLSAKERDLLQLFLSNCGRVLSRERILNAVWGTNADPLTNVVDVYVGRLRRKLRDEGARIVTLRHVGYRLDPTR
ncbi:MAG: response regulator transcription factor [Pseudomonadota bacterium]